MGVLRVSYFSEPYKDALTAPPEAVSAGPRQGFLDSLSNAYDAGVRNSSLFGLEAAFREVEQEQVAAIRRSGGKVRSLNDAEDGEVLGGFTGGVNSKRYFNAAKFFTD